MKDYVGSSELTASTKLVSEYLYSCGLKEANVKLSYLGELIYATMPHKIAKIILNTEFALFQESPNHTICRK